MYFDPTFGMMTTGQAKQVFAPTQAPAPAAAATGAVSDALPLKNEPITVLETQNPPHTSKNQQQSKNQPTSKKNNTSSSTSTSSSTPATSTPDPHLNPLFGPHFPWHSAKWLKWCSPSRKDGVSSAEEDKLRSLGLKRIWDLVRALKRRNPVKPDELIHVTLSHHTIAMAFLYYQIFFARQSVNKYAPEEVAATCVFVAGKLSEERPLAPRFIIAASSTVQLQRQPLSHAVNSMNSSIASLPHSFPTMKAPKQYHELQTRVTSKDVESLLQDRPKGLSQYLLRRLIFQETVLLDTLEYKLQPWSPFLDIERLLCRLCGPDWLNIDIEALPDTDPRAHALDSAYTHATRVGEAVLRHSTLPLHVSSETIAVAAIHAGARLGNVSASLRKPGAPMPWYTAICGIQQRDAEPIIEQARQCRQKIITADFHGKAPPIEYGRGMTLLRVAAAKDKAAQKEKAEAGPPSVPVLLEAGKGRGRSKSAGGGGGGGGRQRGSSNRNNSSSSSAYASRSSSVAASTSTSTSASTSTSTSASAPRSRATEAPLDPRTRDRDRDRGSNNNPRGTSTSAGAGSSRQPQPQSHGQPTDTDMAAVKMLAALASAPSDLPNNNTNASTDGTSSSNTTTSAMNDNDDNDDNDDDARPCPSPPEHDHATTTPTPLPLMVSTPTPMVRSHSGRAADDD
jgi:hypothetical protein